MSSAEIATTVELKPDALKAVYDEGHRRDDSRDWSRNYGIEREQTHIRGLKGELAVAEHYDLSPDLSHRPAGDDGVDFRCWWGLWPVALDVKTTAYVHDPWLKVRADGHHSADVYVLAAVDGVRVDLVGWASQGDVDATEVTRDTGHHDNHVLEPTDLRELPAQTWVEEVVGDG